MNIIDFRVIRGNGPRPMPRNRPASKRPSKWAIDMAEKLERLAANDEEALAAIRVFIGRHIDGNHSDTAW